MAAYSRENLNRVVFSDLSERCNEELLYEMCTQFGPVRNVHWPTVAMSTLSGVAQRATFCFVEFVCPEDAKYCYLVFRDAHVKLFDKEVRVSHASSELAQRESNALAAGNIKSTPSTFITSNNNSSNSGSNMVMDNGNVATSISNITSSQSTLRRGQRGLHEIGAKVIVRNIDRNATEFDISMFFKQFGSFAAPPRLTRDSRGNFRGTVILSYEDFAFSDNVIAEMNNKIFRDRIISVQYAELEDGSGKLHGSDEERQIAILIQEEAKKYVAKVQAETDALRSLQQQQRASNTSWADNVNVYTYKPSSLNTNRR